MKTSENFGFQGEPPSHPKLLDWLATDFIRLKWDVKAFQKMIVMSATYQQTSRVSPIGLKGDPENRLLGRGPRFNLSAFVIRDQALALSGLLVDKLGGPSVKPYLPKGLWEALSQSTAKHRDRLVGDRLQTPARSGAPVGAHRRCGLGFGRLRGSASNRGARRHGRPGLSTADRPGAP